MAVDEYTKLLLHLDEDASDSSSSGHIVTNNNVTFSSGGPFIGGSRAVFF